MNYLKDYTATGCLVARLMEAAQRGEKFTAAEGLEELYATAVVQSMTGSWDGCWLDFLRQLKDAAANGNSQEIAERSLEARFGGK